MIAFGMIFGTGLSYAQEDTHIELEEVLIQEDAAPQLRHGVTPTQTMNRRQLDRFAASQVSDVVKYFSGVVVKDYGGVGGLKTISIRSLGANHTAISYDGVPVGDTQTGQIDLSRFSMSEIDAVSLSNAQQDNMLQTARATASAGVLSLVTHPPSFEEKQYVKGKISLKTGSFGFINPTLSLQGKISDKVSVSLNGEYQYADGDFPFSLNKNAKELFFRKNTDVSLWKSEGNFFFRLNDFNQIALKGYFSGSVRGLPGAVIYYNTYSSQRLSDKNYFAQMKYNFHKANTQVAVRAKYNYAYTHYLDPDYLNEEGKQENTYIQHEYYISGTVLQSFFNSVFQLSLATDFFVNSLDADLYDFPYPTRYSLLNVLAVRFEKWGLVFQANVLSTSVFEQVRTGEKPENTQQFSPSASISYYPVKRIDLQLRMFYKHIFRMPAFNDLYYTGIGNTDLKPEKVNQYNIGITYSKKWKSGIHYLSLSADGYHNGIKDKIMAIPTKNLFVWSMVNFGKVYVNGLDVTLKAAYSPSKNIQLILEGSYTFQQALDMTDTESKTYKNQIPYTPRHSGSCSIGFAGKWIQVNYNLLFSGERYTLGQNIPANRLTPYIEHNLIVSVPFNLNKLSFKGTVEVLNLADTHYEVIANYPMPGRSYKMGLSMNF